MHSVTIEILRGANDAPLRMTACCCVWLTGKMLSHEKFGQGSVAIPLLFQKQQPSWRWHELNTCTAEFRQDLRSGGFLDGANEIGKQNGLEARAVRVQCRGANAVFCGDAGNADAADFQFAETRFEAGGIEPE